MKNLISNFLDTTVVGGFSRIGYEVRSRLGSFVDVESMDLTGRRIVVTGPTSGLGRETCVMLARAGADLVVVGRELVLTNWPRTLAWTLHGIIGVVLLLHVM